MCWTKISSWLDSATNRLSSAFDDICSEQGPCFVEYCIISSTIVNASAFNACLLYCDTGSVRRRGRKGGQFVCQLLQKKEGRKRKKKGKAKKKKPIWTQPQLGRPVSAPTPHPWAHRACFLGRWQAYNIQALSKPSVKELLFLIHSWNCLGKQLESQESDKNRKDGR